MNGSPVHFYHLWTGNRVSQVIFNAHRTALAESGFRGDVRVVQVFSGWEDVTLRALREFCLTADPATPVFYAHAKGAYQDTHGANALWREGMTDRLIRAWRSRVRDLKSYDLVGCHWVVPPAVVSPYFAGNWWWARAGYLATLPELPVLTAESRHEAEKWAARGNPRVKALSEGFESIIVSVRLCWPYGHSGNRIGTRPAR